jgi:hypothetical protein
MIVWTVLEQVALAALECGKTELADVRPISPPLISRFSADAIEQVCATRLSTRFPDSPRVAVILGSMMEGKGMRVEAKVFYEKALESDEGNLVGPYIPITRLNCIREGWEIVERRPILSAVDGLILLSITLYLLSFSSAEHPQTSHITLPLLAFHFHSPHQDTF